MLQIIVRLIGAVHIFIGVIILFTVTPIVLNKFPATKIWARRIEEWLFEPLKVIGNSFIEFIPNLVIIILLIIIAKYVLQLLKYFSMEIEREALKIKGFYKEWARPTYTIIRFLFICLLLIILFPYLPGSGSAAFQGMSIFLGLLISLESSSAISNAIAGILITYMRPFQTQDWIKTGDVIGMVLSKNSLVTRLKTINNEEVSVPNSAILSGATINFSSIEKTDGLVLTAQVKVVYDIEESIVARLLISAAKVTPGITKRIAPYVFQTGLSETGATYEVNAITFEPENMYQIKSDLVQSIHKTFRKENIPLHAINYVDIAPNAKK